MGGHGIQIKEPNWPHYQIEDALMRGATWLIAPDSVAGNIWPILPGFPLNLSSCLPIAQNLASVIALAGDGNGTVFLVSQPGAAPASYSLDYPGGLLGPIGNPDFLPFCHNGIVFTNGGILGMIVNGSIQAFDTGFNPLPGGYPLLPAAPSLLQGLAMDKVNRLLYAACQNTLYYLDLNNPTGWVWGGIDLMTLWELSTPPFPLTLAVESQSGDVYILYLPDAGQPSQANVGVFNPKTGDFVAAFSPANFSPGGGLAVAQVNGSVSVFVSEMSGTSCSIQAYSTATNAWSPVPVPPNLQQVKVLAVTETAVTWQRVTFVK